MLRNSGWSCLSVGPGRWGIYTFSVYRYAQGKTREELNQLFYPDLSRMTAGEKGELYGTEYLVCKQIIRDHDEFAGRRGCRINAEPGRKEVLQYILRYRKNEIWKTKNLK